MHSHTGMEPLPELRGGSDGNELSSDITPYVRSIDGFNPLDPQLQVIKSGGVTTSLILPGSGNNMGGEAFVIKHAVGISDGRTNISQIDMLADPERNWRYMKMACGENPKRVYGHVGKHDGPFSRMGEAWYFRHAFERATEYVKKQDDWCTAADKYGASSMQSYLPQALEWESLAAVLRGQVHVNTHCYTVADLEDYVRYTNEFKFPVRAFHHAHQTYLVPEVSMSHPVSTTQTANLSIRSSSKSTAVDRQQQHSSQTTCTTKSNLTLPPSKLARSCMRMASLPSTSVTTRFSTHSTSSSKPLKHSATACRITQL